ncbi:MAG: 4-phosphoerythronate dehydrogenase [Pseudohongiellaceae bacterium]
MKIVADANILDIEPGFAEYGELVLRPGREIRPADVRDADALIVRSITRVDAALLAGSRVRFVATATSGTDHLDLPWLHHAGITVADAAGCNANAVAAYVMAALQELTVPGGGRAVVIGAGHVGSRVVHRLQRKGVHCRVVDPFVEQGGVSASVRRAFDDRVPELCFSSLDEALADADIVSLHVPYTTQGPHPTRGLLNAERLSRLRPGTVLINTARGEVLDEAALKQRLRSGGDLQAVLDVFHDEPEVDRELIHLARIATPHIAGYSRAAKLAGTARVLAAFRAHFHPEEPVSEAGDRGIALRDETAPSPSALTTRFREAVDAVPADRSLAGAFDTLRRLRLEPDPSAV